jgi:hypothetical protein
VQASIGEVVDSRHGIKVLLSLLCEGERHLPPHAVAMLHVPERTVTVAVTPGEGGVAEADGQDSAAVAANKDKGKVQQVLGESKKDPSTRRYVPGEETS